MSLTLEWRRRVDNWLKELPRHFYRPLGQVDLQGFVTQRQMTLAEAQDETFAEMPAGTAWGAKWDYGWFRGEIILPEAARGKRIALRLEPGGESILFVNGVEAGARDRQHTEITLTREGAPGARYEVYAESYAGHGPRVVSAGPCPLDRETVPEPPEAQVVVGQSTYGIWEEEAYQLWLDVRTLYEIREKIDANSLRVVEIDAGLRDMTVIVDYELEYEAKLATFKAARERLQPLLACVNGSTAPTLYAFGHSHIDVAWLWPLAETERKTGRTLATQLALMEEYPEYTFLQSQPHLFWMLQERYPALYERVKEAARKGQFLPEGGMWVEADTNVSGGESLIRQFLHGKRFFQQEFGVDCELMWLPDVFGYSGAMPQIMKGSGIKYFSTAKIFWAYNGGAPFPYNTFVWEGVDGSEVLVHLCNDYNSHTNPASTIERWDDRIEKDGFSTRLMPFGYGDGGGGPTRDHIEFIRRQTNLEGVPKVLMSTPIAYFEDQVAKGGSSNRYVGELYFQAHRGTYTSQARTKRGNRKSEFALREAEMWGVAALALSEAPYPLGEMDRLWKKVLLNQFHDIIPGSSIHRVYEEAEADYAEVVAGAGAIRETMASSLVEGEAQALTVFNSLSWPRLVQVKVPAELAQGMPSQTDGDGALVEVEVPACGWTTVRATQAKAPVENELVVGARSLENAQLRVAFDDKGDIVSIYDKAADREIVTGACGLRMYKDIPTNWDAWDLDSTYTATPVALNEPAQFEMVAQGPLVATLRITRRLHLSQMVQEVSLRRGARRLDMHTRIDWQERHKLLKVNFPVAIHANEAMHEIQFGYIQRPNHKSRPFDADRFEVANQKWTALMEPNRGVAVLNDCKYGVNVDGNSINLTLLKSAMAPDMTADLGEQVFTYALFAWNGSFADSDLERQAYDLNVPPTTAAGAAGERSLFQIDAPNVIIDTVKPAEDGSKDVIVRLYECKRMSTRCMLTTSLSVSAAAETDMLERETGALQVNESSIALELRPFEIKTVRLKLR